MRRATFAGFGVPFRQNGAYGPQGKLDERPARAGLPSEGDRRKRKL